MIEILKAKIEELEEQKALIEKDLALGQFDVEEEAYLDIVCIDHTVNTLKDLIIAEERECEVRQKAKKEAVLKVMSMKK